MITIHKGLERLSDSAISNENLDTKYTERSLKNCLKVVHYFVLISDIHILDMCRLKQCHIL